MKKINITGGLGWVTIWLFVITLNTCSIATTLDKAVDYMERENLIQEYNT